MLLVTGGAGYIGSHFVREYLSNESDGIVVLDNLSEGHADALSGMNVELVKSDIGDKNRLDSLFQQYDIDAVVHFAANAYVGESQDVPFKYLHNNVVQTINLFEAMEKHGVRRIVFSSTCATYGHPQYVPLDEKHPQNPVNVYGSTKLIVEQMLKALAGSKDWTFVALRYFNAAGAAEDGSMGESHDPETHLIPLVLKTAKGELPHITVLGDDYETPDGTCIRDYIHIQDLALAHCQALALLRAEKRAEFVNLGTETGSSVREVIDLCKQVTGKPIPTVMGPRRKGDPPMLVANATKAEQLLGWRPRHDLSSIIKTAWQWESNRRY
jgi:UDP-glucose 4-epimerase